MKKIISILICIQIALFPAFAFAANVGGWTLGNPIAQGASAIVNGTKTAVINGANVIKNSTAKITPPASAVAKVLARGAAGYALSVAVEQLLGSVDWVLDPANNQIKYKVAVEGSGLYICSYGGVRNSSFMNCASVWESFNKPIKLSGCSELKQTCTATRPSDGYKYTVRPIVSAEVAPKNEERTYPLGPLAQQVINNAAGGDASAQQAIVAAAQDIINEAETDQTKARPIVNQLEANAKTQTDESATAQAKPQADPVTGQQAPPIDISLEFPKFCTWAPTICEAAQVVLTFPNTLTDWYEESTTAIRDAWLYAKEWFTGEPDLSQDQTDLPIEEKTIDRDPSSFDTDYIVLGSQCPTFEPYTVEVGPVSKTLSMDLSPLCDFAAKVRPAILGMSYLTAAGIVVAAIRET